MRTVRVTDTVGTSGSVTVDRDDVAESIMPWYPEAPSEVIYAIEGLQGALNQHEYTGELEEYLGIRIEKVD